MWLWNTSHQSSYSSRVILFSLPRVIVSSLFVQVLDYYTFEDIGEVSTVKSSALQIVMHTGGRVVLQTNKAGEFAANRAGHFRYYVIFSIMKMTFLTFFSILFAGSGVFK